MKTAGVNVTAGFMSCPEDKAVDHKGFFTLEAQSPEAVKKFFGQMAVEVRAAKTLSEVAKTYRLPNFLPQQQIKGK